MCGLAGYIDLHRKLSTDDLAPIAQRMADSMVARGPDDSGVWTDAQSAVALGFRRLAIVDLSTEGHQPMRSRSGRFVIAFNGEIYNFADVRAKLDAADGQHWRGHSDTEVLVEAIEHFGFELTLKMLNGMFAIALWDMQEKTLRLARDRFGEKPLYYGTVGETFMFASEIKALKAHPAWQGDVDWNAMSLFVRHSYIPGAHSAFEGIHKLPPGTWLEVAADGVHGEPQTYWSATTQALHGMASPFQGSYDDAVSELDRLIKDAIGMRTYADVPLGAFLSGGIDSSTVAAVMQKTATRPIKTFSISFSEQAYNEAPFAAAVAAHIGSDHTEMEVGEQACLDVLPQLQATYDEPFADASQIPTMVLSKLTREHVTVALSGDGGDELFLGYGRYQGAPKLWQQAQSLPLSVRNTLGFVLGAQKYLPTKIARRLQKVLAKWSATNPQDLYCEYVSWWKSGDNITPRYPSQKTCFDVPGDAADVLPLSVRYALIDALTYLPDDLLVKVDRASMAASLEVRSPLLDHRIAEFSWTLPENMKIQNGIGKRVLRDVLYRYVPQELVDRPKQGFEPPVAKWLRGGLRDWAGDLLSPARLNDQGFLSAATVSDRWNEHSSGRRNWAYPLWNVLMLQAWLDDQ